MTSGFFVYSVGRLPSGDIVLVDDMDEMPGAALALRGTYSDLDAVKLYLTRIGGDEGFYVFPLLLAVFRDHGQIGYASELDSEWSDTLEIRIEVNLTDEDLARLIPWAEAQSR